MITGEQVMRAALKANIKRVDCHPCSMCNYMTCYLVDDDILLFDSGCHCTRRYAVDQRSWDDAANWINMQSNEEVRNKIAKAFGLELEAK